MVDTDNLIKDLRQFTEVIVKQGPEFLAKTLEDGNTETLMTLLQEMDSCLKRFTSLGLLLDDLENQSLHS